MACFFSVEFITPERFMFKIDMHIHTTLGRDSDIKPEEVIPFARSAGLDAVCITEHHDYFLSEVFERLSAEQCFPVFRGMEYSAAEGHLLVFGARLGRSDFLQGLPMQRVIDWVNSRGGVAIPAHPYQRGIVGNPLGDRLFNLTGIAAVEVINGSNSEEETGLAKTAAERMGLNGIGGSDAHGLHRIGSAYTCFPEPVTTEVELVEALKRGSYYPCRMA